MIKRLLAISACAMLTLAACGDDDDDDADAVPTVGPAPTVGGVEASVPTGTDGVVTVVATDYKFSGLPATVPAGATFALKNDSTEEVHEMIIIRIPDEETRTIGQLAALPEAEADAVFEGIEPTTVIVALPGEVGQAVEGDGVVAEAGRYAVVCFIPKGADPALVKAAMSDPESTGPPDLGTGPPHITQGMYAEVTIS